MKYLGMAVVLALAWYALRYGWQEWRRAGNWYGALGVAVYALVGVGLAFYQLFLR